MPDFLATALALTLTVCPLAVASAVILPVLVSVGLRWLPGTETTTCSDLAVANARKAQGKLASAQRVQSSPRELVHERALKARDSPQNVVIRSHKDDHGEFAHCSRSN